MLQSLLSAEAELFVLFAVEAFKFRLANLCQGRRPTESRLVSVLCDRSILLRSNKPILAGDEQHDQIAE